MGRKPKDLRLEQLKERLLSQIAGEQDMSRLKDLLACYNSVTAILEHKEQKRIEKKLAKPQVS